MENIESILSLRPLISLLPSCCIKYVKDQAEKTIKECDNCIYSRQRALFC